MTYACETGGKREKRERPSSIDLDAQIQKNSPPSLLLSTTTPALNADAAVASLADSLVDPTAPLERRREAAERLRDLLADYPSAQEAVGSAGLPSLAAALRHQPRDLDTLRAVLECLSSALGEVAGTAASNAEAEFQQVRGWGARVFCFSSSLSFLPFFLSLSPLFPISLKKKKTDNLPGRHQLRALLPRPVQCLRAARAAF